MASIQAIAALQYDAGQYIGYWRLHYALSADNALQALGQWQAQAKCVQDRLNEAIRCCPDTSHAVPYLERLNPLKCLHWKASTML